ncbi:DUF3040 domain-containing protein [Actinomadura sp. 7K534]|uniref:DUF3040 domain-containing protein n=1 Tax=Actinomadura sp. 7K534 TaxID=2530366 RepID=UPI0014049EDE|nr:DUF3040 domain-containing protein [Actinomadura sp. 7K534]
MGLSEHERAVLRHLDAEFDRRDPWLSRRLAEFGVPPEEPCVSWRPPRAAVVLAAVMVAATAFLAAVIPLVMRQPCPVSTGAQATPGAAERAAGPSPSPTC